MIRVLVADDQELIREGLSLILAAQPDIEVVGVACDGVEAITMTRALEPDVVLMDVRMPNLDGIAASHRILRDDPGCRILVLTTFGSDDAAISALRAGASGFLLKDAPRGSLIAAVRAVAEGDVLLDADVVRRIVAAEPVPPAADARPLEGLTPRETEVLLAVARGLSNAEIAAELGVRPATVKTHVANLLEKLGVRDRVQLVVLAHTCGAVPRG